MGLFRRKRAALGAAIVVETVTAASMSDGLEPVLDERADDLGDVSDVYVCSRDATPDVEGVEGVESDPSVTLFVTGWHNVEPGPLSWPFPSMRAALDAVRKMKNAIEWSIALGTDYTTIEEARASGLIVIEQRA